MERLDELKSTWQRPADSHKSASELEKMTKVKHHPTLKRIRLKLIVETIFLLFLTFVYRDWFDGASKPIWANAMLIASIFLFISNDLVSFFALYKPIKADNIRLSIKKQVSHLKTLSYFSLIFSFGFGICLTLFLTAGIAFTLYKYMIGLGLLITLVITIYISYRNWNARILHFSKIDQEFEN